jgi:hypothetical protein
MKSRYTAAAAAAVLLMLWASAPRRSPPSLEIVPSPSPEALYRLAEYDGRLAVFRAGSGSGPILVTSVRTALLPSADRTGLAEGIAAADDRELARLLEDLS